MLLPVHNTSATLGAALDSLLAQSLPDFEVVALDDGSSDGTLALQQVHAQRDAVEHFLRAKAHYLLAGPLHNRERVIILGRGRWGGAWPSTCSARARRWRHFCT